MEELKFMDGFNIVKDCLNILLTVITITVQLYGIIFVIKALELTKEELENAKKELKNSEEVHASTLEWNKKKATDEVLEVKPDREVTKRLNENFQTSENSEPIELIKILNKIKEDHQFQLDIQHLLNVYERLGRGMKNDIYVEEIVKDGLMNTFIKVYDNYSLYIIDHRNKVNERAWIDFETYVEKWRE